MTDSPIPPRQSLSRMFLGGLVTTSIFCGALGGLGILFIGDSFFDKTLDPAIHFAELHDDLAKTQARLDSIEQKIAAQPAVDTSEIQADLQKLKSKLTLNKQKTTALENQVAQIGNSAGDSQSGRIVLGLTQIKTAFDNDMSMQPGIDTLKSSFKDVDVQKNLDDLASMAATVPTLAALSEEIKKLKPKKDTTIPLMTPPTWEDRAKMTLSKFVSVRPVDIVTQETQTNRALTALERNDLPLARATLLKMPSSPAVEKIIAGIDTRLKAQGIVQTLVTSITKNLGQDKTGSLY